MVYACFHFNKAIIAFDSHIFLAVCVRTCQRHQSKFAFIQSACLKLEIIIQSICKCVQEFQIIRHAPIFTAIFSQNTMTIDRKQIILTISKRQWVQLNWFLRLTDATVLKSRNVRARLGDVEETPIMINSTHDSWTEWFA